jgi:hypothetical protein
MGAALVVVGMRTTALSKSATSVPNLRQALFAIVDFFLIGWAGTG